MRATPRIREALISMKIEHWYYVAIMPGSSVSTIRDARRNYWRLVRKYPQIAEKGSWTEEKILKEN